jgi:hypothetical protein
MDFLVFSNVLKLDPMSYSVISSPSLSLFPLIPVQTLQDTFLVVFFESLVSWHTTSEDDYIKLLLSIDGLQHPLFRGIMWDPDRPEDVASNIDLLTARLPLMTGSILSIFLRTPI